MNATCDEIERRHNVHVLGTGRPAMVFVHGFGCNQSMWRHLVDAFARTHQIVLYDLMGCGLSQVDGARTDHATLDGHSRDLLDIIRCTSWDDPVIVVGHSIGAAIAGHAELMEPSLFRAKVFVSPSPCFVDDAPYRGGFSAADIEQLTRFMSDDCEAWARSFARLVAGSTAARSCGAEWFESFCRMHPAAVEPFTNLTFGIDVRDELPLSVHAALILQATDDVLAPVDVGKYMASRMPGSTLGYIETSGHMPHLTAPGQCIMAIHAFLDSLRLTEK